ncbi:protein O-GlcNAcase-like isoform X2 [Corticium candelabrum]|nr:protein O-GlcNAcase-like isoform X2 [Corticium candelabrum]
MNSYMYAPKDDHKHRAGWRELYTASEAGDLKDLIFSSQSHDVNFIYALSPGLDMILSGEKEMALLKSKMDQVRQMGCKSFALLFDDIEEELSPADKRSFTSFAEAQVHVTNLIYEHLGQPEIFLFCPTEYCSSRADPSVAKSQYLLTLGEKLHPAINIFWTGPRVISKVISTESIGQVMASLKRQPVIWDNIHANDYDQRRLFLGPYDSRSTELYPMLNGILTNPNCEFEPNFIAIHTLASWFHCAQAKHRKGNHLSVKAKIEPMDAEPEQGQEQERSSPHEEVMQAESKEESGEEKLNDDGSDAGDAVVEDAVVEDVSCADRHDSGTESGMEIEPTNSAEVQNFDANEEYDLQMSLKKAVRAWLTEFAKPISAAGIQPKVVSAAAVAEVQKEIKGGEIGEKNEDSIEPRDKDESSPKRHRQQDVRKMKTQMTEEDVALLVDLFYLPHQHGPRAVELMKEFHWLKKHANISRGQGTQEEPEMREDPSHDVKMVSAGENSSDTEASEMEDDSVGGIVQSRHWMARANAFRHNCKRISHMFVQLTDIPNRALLYDLYPYIWDVKEVVMLLDAYIAWLEAGCKKKGKQISFLPEDMEPWIFRGGIAAEMQRLLPSCDGPEGLFSSDIAPAEPSSRVFTVRPYRREDEALTYKVCLLTGDAGTDGTHLYPHYPDLLGKRYVGPYIHLCPDFAFVVEDEEGVCGYILGALDSRLFYEQYTKEWLPKLLSEHKLPKKNKEDFTAEDSLVYDIHTEELFLPDELYNQYPSHLHIDLIPRAQGLGVGKRMVQGLLSALKTQGSTGVFLEMAPKNDAARRFYYKLGFHEPLLKEGTIVPDDTAILARKL